MQRFLKIFLSDDSGQDLIEYSLLLAFVALASAGLFLDAGSNTRQVWSSANSVLTTAAGSTGSQAPPPAPGGGDHGGDHRD